MDDVTIATTEPTAAPENSRRAPRSTAPRDGRRGDGRVYKRPNSSVWWIRFLRRRRNELAEPLAVGARTTVAELLDGLQADYTPYFVQPSPEYLARLPFLLRRAGSPREHR